MNFADIKADDPRWTSSEKAVFMHLFRTRQRYLDEGRKLESHGVAKAIFVMANVLAALTSKPDPFKDLL